jgi:type I restriction enzyme M protein
LEEIEKNGFVLTPGRYVGTADGDLDEEKFTVKIERLTGSLSDLRTTGNKLDTDIEHALRRLFDGDD